VLCERSERADAAIAEILIACEKQTGQKPDVLTGSSPGAWQVGTEVVC